MSIKLKFKLSTLLIAFLVFSLVLGWFSACLKNARLEKEVIENLTAVVANVDAEATVSVFYDYQFEGMHKLEQGFFGTSAYENQYNTSKELSWNWIRNYFQLPNLFQQIIEIRIEFPSRTTDRVSTIAEIRSLSSLKGLRTIIITEKPRRRWSGRTSKHLPSNKFVVRNLDLRGLKKLTRLDVECCDHIQLDSFSSIRSVRAGRRVIDSLPLDEMRSLEELIVFDSGTVKSLEEFSVLRNLEKFQLACDRIDSFDGLQKLPCLKILGLNCNSVKDQSELHKLSTLKGLQRLTILNCESLTNLSCLPQFEKLSHLNCEQCRNLSNVDALSNFRNLEFVHLGSTNLHSLAGISNLPKLKELTLRGCPCETLKGVKHLPNLETLNITGCEALVDIEDLSIAVNLKRLYAMWCPKVQSANFLSQLPSLEFVNLALPMEQYDNGYLDVSGLRELSQTIELQFNNRRISQSDIKWMKKRFPKFRHEKPRGR